MIRDVYAEVIDSAVARLGSLAAQRLMFGRGSAIQRHSPEQ